MFVIRRGMFLLSLTATCQVYTVSLKAGLYTYNGFTLRTLDAPDGEPAQTDPDLMGVAGQAPTAATGRLVGELKAERQHEGEDTLEKRLPIAQQLKVRGFVSQIDGNGTVVSNRFGRCAHRSPLCPQVSEADET